MIEKYSNFNPEFKAIICNNIKVYRKEKGVRLMDLAEILDVSPEYLKRIESPNDTKKNCDSGNLKITNLDRLIFTKNGEFTI